VLLSLHGASCLARVLARPILAMLTPDGKTVWAKKERKPWLELWSRFCSVSRNSKKRMCTLATTFRGGKTIVGQEALFHGHRSSFCVGPFQTAVQAYVTVTEFHNCSANEYEVCKRIVHAGNYVSGKKLCVRKHCSMVTVVLYHSPFFLVVISRTLFAHSREPSEVLTGGSWQDWCLPQSYTVDKCEKFATASGWLVVCTLCGICRPAEVG
jgi:hypothetical protein